MLIDRAQEALRHRWFPVLAAAMSILAMLAIAGCNAVYGLGTDLQTMSEVAQTRLVVDDPAND